MVLIQSVIIVCICTFNIVQWGQAQFLDFDSSFVDEADTDVYIWTPPLELMKYKSHLSDAIAQGTVSKKELVFLYNHQILITEELTIEDALQWNYMSHSEYNDYKSQSRRYYELEAIAFNTNLEMGLAGRLGLINKQQADDFHRLGITFIRFHYDILEKSPLISRLVCAPTTRSVETILQQSLNKKAISQGEYNLLMSNLVTLPSNEELKLSSETSSYYNLITSYIYGDPIHQKGQAIIPTVVEVGHNIATPLIYRAGFTFKAYFMSLVTRGVRDATVQYVTVSDKRSMYDICIEYSNTQEEKGSTGFPVIAGDDILGHANRAHDAGNITDAEYNEILSNTKVSYRNLTLDEALKEHVIVQTAYNDAVAKYGPNAIIEETRTSSNLTVKEALDIQEITPEQADAFIKNNEVELSMWSSFIQDLPPADWTSTSTTTTTPTTTTTTTTPTTTTKTTTTTTTPTTTTTTTTPTTTTKTTTTTTTPTTTTTTTPTTTSTTKKTKTTTTKKTKTTTTTTTPTTTTTTTPTTTTTTTPTTTTTSTTTPTTTTTTTTTSTSTTPSTTTPIPEPCWFDCQTLTISFSNCTQKCPSISIPIHLGNISRHAINEFAKSFAKLLLPSLREVEVDLLSKLSGGLYGVITITDALKEEYIIRSQLREISMNPIAAGCTKQCDHYKCDVAKLLESQAINKRQYRKFKSNHVLSIKVENPWMIGSSKK